MNESPNYSRVPPGWGTALTEADYTSLEASWISQDLADVAMLRRVDAIEGRAIVGQKGNRDCAGLVFPGYWPGEPRPFTYRIRRDNPEWTTDKDGRAKPEAKYLGAPGAANRVYVPPGITVEQIGDVSIPLVIVEGEKKSLALWRLANLDVAAPRWIALAISGVWCWLGTTGKTYSPKGARIDTKGPISDLNRIAWKSHRVFITFDTNVHSNPKVRAARSRLARELTLRGATVEFVTPPEDCGVNGIDDLLAAWGPERVLELFDSAEPVASKDQPSQAQILVQLAQEARLFHTPERQAFAQVPTGAYQEILMLRSKDFRRWLTGGFYREFLKPPGAQALQDALGMLEAKAQFDSAESQLYVRVAEREDRIYIDLYNAEREVVEIGAEGWRLITEAPVYFRRTNGMRPLKRPVVGDSISMLRKFINVGNDDNWVLCASWLAAACRAKGPYPILIIQGEQGAAKSTMEKVLRLLIDPSVALARTPPKDDRDLLITAINSWIIAIDNVSGIPPWLSDGLCRLATGGGFSTRQLYTDSDEVFFDATRPVILNGIDHLAERADLADRALILNLPPIAEDNRMDEAQLYADFERDLPKILGALFSAVSCALRCLPQTKLERKPRMADFALWATASEQALGFEPGAFMRAYCQNRADTIEDTLEADPVGSAVLAMIDSLREQGEAERWDGGLNPKSETGS